MLYRVGQKGYSIDMDAVSEVKNRLNIEDVISEYVQLKRAGRNFKGLSPWTNEKTPSFIVSPEKQIWHDFSSGKGGDIFGFVMEVEGLDFKQALELLARKAGVDIEQFSPARSSENTRYKKRAQEALELATKFYQKQLPANKTAIDYLLHKRKFSKKTIIGWRLGYAPNTGTALATFLTKHGFTTEETKRAGLTTIRAGRPADMFRGRIIIPLCDASGSVVGFTARILADDPNAPKYINTPQTVIYDKSRNVFGLHMAKESIRKQALVVVAEGQLDVISSHQAGVANVVAAGGTAMTESHLRELKRFTGDIRLCFDADRAGISATERIIPIAQKVEVNLKIIRIKDAKDPDELVQKDVKAWEKAIEQAAYAPDWLIEQYKNELDLSSAQGKRAFTDVLLGTIRRLGDQIEQEHYLKMIARLTDTSLEAVRAKFIGKPAESQRYKSVKATAQPIDKEKIEYRRLQDHFLSMVFMQPKLRPLTAGLKSEYFSDGPPREVYEFLAKNPELKGNPKVYEQLRESADYVKIIMLQFEELYENLPYKELEEQATHLKNRLINQYVKIQKHILADAMDEADGKQVEKLIKQVDKLNQLIKSREGM